MEFKKWTNSSESLISRSKYCVEDIITSAQKIVIWWCLVPSQGMVAEDLRKIHNKIICRHKQRPKLANPWLRGFSVDMPTEVFTRIFKDILYRTNFGHEFSLKGKQTYNCFTQSLIFERPNPRMILKKSHSIVEGRGVRWLFGWEANGVEVATEIFLWLLEHQRCTHRWIP